MTRTRLEAFSDGVFAIVITIMILEVKIPAGHPTLEALKDIKGEFGAYVMSFVFLGIYWVNHHHFMHTIDRVNGAILWGNLHLLFWLSLVPATTAWLGEDFTQRIPTIVYGLSLLMPALAWNLMARSVIKFQGEHSKLRAIIGKDIKGKMSGLLYVLAIACAFVNPIISDVIFVGTALMWIVPDRRIERHLGS